MVMGSQYGMMGTILNYQSDLYVHSYGRLVSLILIVARRIPIIHTGRCIPIFSFDSPLLWLCPYICIYTDIHILIHQNKTGKLRVLPLLYPAGHKQSQVDGSLNLKNFRPKAWVAAKELKLSYHNRYIQ